MAGVVAPLVNGFPLAPSGTAEFYNQGTGTLASVYSDPENVTLVTSHVLDASGSITRYVKARVDVVVKNVGGATVKSFTWGTDAREDRVENAGFTGTLAGGGTGPGGRTTVDAVLTSLYASLGAVDGKVLVNGSGVFIQTALAGISGLVFNVKSYGAVGNGTTDDRAAIVAALAAAIIAGGGVIYFPPGTYKILGQISIPANTKIVIRGASESSVTIKQFTNATNGWFLNATDPVTISDLSFSADAAVTTGRAVQTNGGKVNLYNCTFNQGSWSSLYSSTVAGGAFNCHGCKFNVAGASQVGKVDVATRMRFSACAFNVTASGGELFTGSTEGLGSTLGASFMDCDFSVSGTGVSVGGGDATITLVGGSFVASGASGSYSLGISVKMSDVYIDSPDAPVELAGYNLSETGSEITFNTEITFGDSGFVNFFESAYRDGWDFETTLVGATVSYEPDTSYRTHQITYPGTNVGTLTIDAPTTGCYAIGTRMDLIITHSGVSGPAALAWNSTYRTMTAGGAAMTASIAMGATLRFSFLRVGTCWLLVAA